ncbi:MAG: hypothetical protein RJB60_1531, partial [Pseudomonadota bacterium]
HLDCRFHGPCRHSKRGRRCLIRHGLFLVPRQGPVVPQVWPRVVLQHLSPLVLRGL